MNFKITNPYEMITQNTNCFLDSHINITLRDNNDHISYKVWIEWLTFFKSKLSFKKSLTVSSIRKYIKKKSNDTDDLGVLEVIEVIEVNTDSNIRKLYTETTTSKTKIFSNPSSEYALQLNTKIIKDDIDILKSHMKYDSVLDCLEYTFNFDKYKCVFSEIVPQEENTLSHKYYTITIFDCASNSEMENILDIFFKSSDNYWKLLTESN